MKVGDLVKVPADNAVGHEVLQCVRAPYPSAVMPVVMLVELEDVRGAGRTVWLLEFVEVVPK